MNKEHKYKDKDEYKDNDKDKDAERITESLKVCYILENFCLCLFICVPYSFLNNYYHKLSENVWV